MLRKLVFILAIASVIMLFLARSGEAQLDVANGRLVTCPGGEPIAGAQVHIYEGEEFLSYVTTDANGWYEFGIDNLCDRWITVSIGEPDGHGCSGSCCSERTLFMDCGSAPITYGDLEFECGVGRKPPCPGQ